jgi:hypothetical protein
MIDYSNIGKQVIYDKSHDNIDDYVLGTIIGCYIGADETYYIVSIESQGKVEKVFDDALLEIIDSGGPSITVEALTATENKTYTAPSGKAYSPVTVAVPTQEATLAALIDRSITSVVIPSDVTSIGSGAFYGAKQLSSVTVHDNVTIVYDEAFRYCAALQSVILGSGLSEIKAQAFAGCKALQSITFKSTNPPTVANSNAFLTVPSSCVITVPAGSLSAYQSATNYPNPNTYTYVEDLP